MAFFPHSQGVIGLEARENIIERNIEREDPRTAAVRILKAGNFSVPFLSIVVLFEV